MEIDDKIKRNLNDSNNINNINKINDNLLVYINANLNNKSSVDNTYINNRNKNSVSLFKQQQTNNKQRNKTNLIPLLNSSLSNNLNNVNYNSTLSNNDFNTSNKISQLETYTTFNTNTNNEKKNKKNKSSMRLNTRNQLFKSVFNLNSDVYSITKNYKGKNKSIYSNLNWNNYSTFFNSQVNSNTNNTIENSCIISDINSNTDFNELIRNDINSKTGFKADEVKSLNFDLTFNANFNQNNYKNNSNATFSRGNYNINNNRLSNIRNSINNEIKQSKVIRKEEVSNFHSNALKDLPFINKTTHKFKIEKNNKGNENNILRDNNKILDINDISKRKEELILLRDNVLKLNECFYNRSQKEDKKKGNIYTNIKNINEIDSNRDSSISLNKSKDNKDNINSDNDILNQKEYKISTINSIQTESNKRNNKENQSNYSIENNKINDNKETITDINTNSLKFNYNFYFSKNLTHSYLKINNSKESAFEFLQKTKELALLKYLNKIKLNLKTSILQQNENQLLTLKQVKLESEKIYNDIIAKTSKFDDVFKATLKIKEKNYSVLLESKIKRTSLEVKIKDFEKKVSNLKELIKKYEEYRMFLVSVHFGSCDLFEYGNTKGNEYNGNVSEKMVGSKNDKGFVNTSSLDVNFTYIDVNKEFERKCGLFLKTYSCFNNINSGNIHGNNNASNHNNGHHWRHISVHDSFNNSNNYNKISQTNKSYNKLKSRFNSTSTKTLTDKEKRNISNNEDNNNSFKAVSIFNFGKISNIKVTNTNSTNNNTNKIIVSNNHISSFNNNINTNNYSDNYFYSNSNGFNLSNRSKSDKKYNNNNNFNSNNLNFINSLHNIDIEDGNSNILTIPRNDSSNFSNSNKNTHRNAIENLKSRTLSKDKDRKQNNKLKRVIINDDNNNINYIESFNNVSNAYNRTSTTLNFLNNTSSNMFLIKPSLKKKQTIAETSETNYIIYNNTNNNAINNTNNNLNHNKSNYNKYKTKQTFSLKDSISINSLNNITSSKIHGKLHMKHISSKSNRHNSNNNNSNANNNNTNIKAYYNSDSFKNFFVNKIKQNYNYSNNSNITNIINKSEFNHDIQIFNSLFNPFEHLKPTDIITSINNLEEKIFKLISYKSSLNYKLIELNHQLFSYAEYLHHEKNIKKKHFYESKTSHNDNNTNNTNNNKPFNNNNSISLSTNKYYTPLIDIYRSKNNELKQELKLLQDKSKSNPRSNNNNTNSKKRNSNINSNCNCLKELLKDSYVDNTVNNKHSNTNKFSFTYLKINGDSISFKEQFKIVLFNFTKLFFNLVEILINSLDKEKSNSNSLIELFDIKKTLEMLRKIEENKERFIKIDNNSSNIAYTNTNTNTNITDVNGKLKSNKSVKSNTNNLSNNNNNINIRALDIGNNSNSHVFKLKKHKTLLNTKYLPKVEIILNLFTEKVTSLIEDYPSQYSMILKKIDHNKRLEMIEIEKVKKSIIMMKLLNKINNRKYLPIRKNVIKIQKHYFNDYRKDKRKKIFKNYKNNKKDNNRHSNKEVKSKRNNMNERDSNINDNYIDIEELGINNKINNENDNIVLKELNRRKSRKALLIESSNHNIVADTHNNNLKNIDINTISTGNNKSTISSDHNKDAKLSNLALVLDGKTNTVSLFRNKRKTKTSFPNFTSSKNIRVKAKLSDSRREGLNLGKLLIGEKLSLIKINQKKNYLENQFKELLSFQTN